MLKNILFREKIIDLTRQFFLHKHFQEITSPCLADHPPYESTLHAFSTINYPLNTKYYLPTSPEIHLKKLISQGLGNCFSIAHSFRNLEANNDLHLPEFLMLEWYEIGKNYLDVIKTTTKLINYVCERLGNRNTKLATKLLDLRTLFWQYANINLDIFLTSPNFSESDFNQIFLNKVESHIPKDKLVFILNYPISISYFAKPIKENERQSEQFLGAQRTRVRQLAESPKVVSTAKIRSRADEPLYCQRFETYLNGIEIANGNTEDTKNPFKIPSCAGCGLGLDRLALIFANSNFFAL